MTLKQWYDTIWGQLSGFSLITELDPTMQETAVRLVADLRAGQQSRFRLIRLEVACVAFACWLAEAQLARHILEVEETNRQKKLHSEAYFAEKAREFRWDSSQGRAYVPEVDPVSYQVVYPEAALADESALVVSAASATTDDTVVIVKVATGPSGNLSPLSPEQVEGCRAYLDACAGAGQYVMVVSTDADYIRYNVEIYYKAIYGEAKTLALVQAAAEAYLSTGIVFDGKCILTKQGDVWQALESGNMVLDYRFVSAEGRSATGSYIDFNREYQAVSGHMRLDSASTFIMIPA